MFDTSLPPHEVASVLAWLGLPPPTPTRAWLDALLASYGQRVPWESASRIVRRASVGTPDEAVASPRAFWDTSRRLGWGGTCFESNAALAALLDAVGIPSVLTINDRPPLPACHTALIVNVDGERLVVDAGFPLYAAVPLPDGDEVRAVTTPWGTFSAARAGKGRYAIGQQPHPRPLAFELVDRPVAPTDYARAASADYGPEGLFLDRVVVKKVVDGDVWRFASSERPWVLERFRDGVRETRSLPADSGGAAAAIARHFSMDEATVVRAIGLVSP